jgi:phosphopantetheinyl transferase (holo-ACP synthase)
VNTAEAAGRCGIDTVEIARVERLLRETPVADLGNFFTAEELRDAARGRAGRRASPRASRPRKPASSSFPREATLGKLGQADFARSRARQLRRAPTSCAAPPRSTSSPATASEGSRYSLTHDRMSASAMALAEPARTTASTAGKLLYHLLPMRRGVIRENLRRVYGDGVPDEEITRLAQAHYGHLGRLALEFLWFPWITAARRAAMVRVENLPELESALAQGKGVLVLTGHFGNFEVATSAGLDRYPQARGRFLVRTPSDQARLARRTGEAAGFAARASASCLSAAGSRRSSTASTPAT